LIHPSEVLSFVAVELLIIQFGLDPSELQRFAERFGGPSRPFITGRRFWGLVVSGSTLIAATLVASFAR
jgi:hypothetical protein